MRRQGLSVLLRSVHTGAAAAVSGRRASRSRLGYTVALSFGLGSAVGGYMAVDQWRRTQHSIPNPTEDNAYLLNEKPSFAPSRIVSHGHGHILWTTTESGDHISPLVKYPMDTTGLTLTLYQYQTCPFCCKVRAMLDYFGISYNVVEVNPVLRTQLKWSEKYRKVPILIVETPEGEVIQLRDSSMIVSALFSFLEGQRNIGTTSGGKKENQSALNYIANCYPGIKFTDDKGNEQTDIMNKYFLMYEGEAAGRTKQDILEERKWRKWVDSVYVHTLSPNIYRTWDEALDSFNYFDKVGEWDKNFSRWERTLVIYVGAFAMWMVGKRLQKRHNLYPDVRKSLYEESEFWIKNIKKRGGGDFMGGSKPDLSDLAVYGVLSSIEGCQAFRDLNENSSIVKEWYRKVQKSIGHSEQI